jgi:hypothetical protein
MPRPVGPGPAPLWRAPDSRTLPSRHWTRLYRTVSDERKGPLRLGQSARSGSFTFSPESVDCGNDQDDLPADLQGKSVFDGGVPKMKGQYCIALLSMRNNSNAFLPVTPLLAMLLVDKQEFLAVGASPLIPPTVFPSERTEVTMIFDIPATVSPTKLRLQSLVGEEGTGTRSRCRGCGDRQ